MKSAEEILNPYIFEKAGKVNVNDAIKAMHEYAAQDRWVKVSERMPNIGSTVLVYPVRESFRNNQIGYSIVYNSDNKPKFEYTGITHWMELPTPPKD